MQLQLLLLALLSLSASSLSPSAPASRRSAFATLTAGAALGLSTVLPAPALADGARSAATKSRARGIYGSRIAALEPAARAGDFAAFGEESKAFVLFNSGALDKKDLPDAIEATNAVFGAVKAQVSPGVEGGGG